MSKMSNNSNNDHLSECTEVIIDESLAEMLARSDEVFSNNERNYKVIIKEELNSEDEERTFEIILQEEYGTKQWTEACNGEGYNDENNIGEFHVKEEDTPEEVTKENNDVSLNDQRNNGEIYIKEEFPLEEAKNVNHTIYIKEEFLPEDAKNGIVEIQIKEEFLLEDAKSNKVDIFNREELLLKEVRNEGIEMHVKENNLLEEIVQSNCGASRGENIEMQIKKEYSTEEAVEAIRGEIDTSPREVVKNYVHLENRSLEATEVCHGEKYIAQGPNNETVWWSIASQRETIRTYREWIKRQQALPTITGHFHKKSDSFKTILSFSIIETIVMETNKQGRSTLKHWSDTNVDEIYAFIGLLLYAGAERADLSQPKELFDKQNMPFYRAVMNLNRFEQLCRLIRFDDAHTLQERLKNDKLAPIRHIWTIFCSNLPKPYAASKELKISEQFLWTKNACSFGEVKQSQLGKCSIKIFWLVDVKTNYPLAAEVLLDPHLHNKGPNGNNDEIVYKLTKHYLNKGVNIHMDSSFTNYNLAYELAMQYNTTILGKIKKDMPELPKTFTSNSEAREASSSLFCFCGPCQLMSFTTQTKKNILLLSTAHAAQINQETQKPLIISDYYKYKDVSDTFNKKLRALTCKLKTVRWSVEMFCNMVDVAGLVAFCLNTRKFCPAAPCKNKQQTRRKFLKELAYDLALKHMQRRAKTSLQKQAKIALELLGLTVESTVVDPQSIPTRQENGVTRRCEHCKGTRRDNKTTAVCDSCLKATCSKHYIRLCKNCCIIKFKRGDGDESEDIGNNSYGTGNQPPAKKQKLS